MERFLQKFGFESVDGLDAAFSRAQKDFAERGKSILAFERYEIFTYMTEHLAEIRDALARDDDNLLYCYLLSDAIRTGNDILVKAIARPKKAEKSELFDTLPLFGMLDCLPDMLAEHKSLGLPTDVTEGTCSQFENQIQDFIDLNHRYGISTYVMWMLGFLKTKIIRVGRFNLERGVYKKPFDVFRRGEETKVLPRGVKFHRNGQIFGSVDCEGEDGAFEGDIVETDTYYEGLRIENGIALNERVRLDKGEWQRVLTRGDAVIEMHIPSGGALSSEVCERDIARGRELFDRHFGGYRALTMTSWLLDPQIKHLLGKETNLTRFADRFERFPVKSNGYDVFEYVWCLPPTTPLSELPENSSISRTVKAHLQSGGHIFGATGIIL